MTALGGHFLINYLRFAALRLVLLAVFLAVFFLLLVFFLRLLARTTVLGLAFFLAADFAGFAPKFAKASVCDRNKNVAPPTLMIIVTTKE